jgi:hypothetical protein
MQIVMVLGLLILAIVLFALETISVDVITILLLIGLVVSGILTPAEAFAGFSSDIIIILASIFVDNQGTTAEAITQALEAAGVSPLIVVDHHEAQERLKPEFSDIRRTGAVATLYAKYLEQGLVEMDKSRQEHVIAATALMHGILSDTQGFNNQIKQKLFTKIGVEQG